MASRSVKYDLKRKMSYFKIAFSTEQTSFDLYTAVQKYIHMIELYHLNLRSNIADFESSESSEEPFEDEDSLSPPADKKEKLNRRSSVTGAFAGKRDYTIKELLTGKIKSLKSV